MKSRSKETGDTYIKSISPVNNIPLSLNGQMQPLDRPVWKKGISSSKEKQMAVFDIAKHMPALLSVELSSIPANTEDCYLEGVTKDKVLFSGKVEKKKKVEVSCHENPGQASHFQNESLQWQLRLSPDKVMALGKTEFDLYWISLSQVSHGVRKKGIPVELIKKVIPEADKSSIAEKQASSVLITVETLVNSVIGNVPPRYDIVRGANYFTTINSWNNITLHYNAYLAAHASLPNSILNCYDAAAVLQHYLMYNRYSTKYCYMNPFGYLRQTNLIGRGQCNNPFYGGNGTSPVVNRLDPNRTAFGNHAFVYLTSNQAVADACAGPHTGNEYAPTYVNNATDDVYPNPPRVQRGKAANIGYYTGVTTINAISGVHTVFDVPHLKALKKLVTYNPKVINSNASKMIAGKWKHPLKHKNLSTWSSVYEEIVPGEEEVLKMYMLKKGDNMIMLKVYVSSGGNILAANRFLTLASLSHLAVLPFEKGPENTGHFSVVSQDSEGSHFIGVFHNVVMDIHSTGSEVNTTEIAKWYFDWAKKQIASSSKHLPVANLRLSGSVNDKLSVTIKSPGNTLLNHVDEEENTRLVSVKDKELTFDKIGKDIRKMSFTVLDKDTLLVKKYSVPLKRVK